MGIIIIPGQLDRPDDDDRPIETISLEETPMEYRTFEDSVKPKVAVYYLFNSGTMGIYREYRCDLERFVCDEQTRVFPVADTEHFVGGERPFLSGLEHRGVQALYVRMVNGMPFREYSRIMSEMHGLKYFNLLKQMGFNQIRELFETLNAPDDLMDKLFNGALYSDEKEHEDKGYDGWIDPNDLWGDLDGDEE